MGHWCADRFDAEEGHDDDDDSDGARAKPKPRAKKVKLDADGNEKKSRPQKTDRYNKWQEQVGFCSLQKTPGIIR